jgi:hypothetical protein
MKKIADLGLRNEEWMKKFSPDQLIFALVLGAVILGLTIYRIFYIF